MRIRLILRTLEDEESSILTECRQKGAHFYLVFHNVEWTETDGQWLAEFVRQAILKLRIKLITILKTGGFVLTGIARTDKGGIRQVIKRINRLGELVQLEVVHTQQPDIAKWVVTQLAQETGFPRDQIWVAEADFDPSSIEATGIIATPRKPFDDIYAFP